MTEQPKLGKTEPKKGRKSTKQPLSDEAKEALRAGLKELAEGAVAIDSIKILPKGVHTATDYKRIADVLRGGQAYIIEYRASRNTIYNIRKHLKDDEKLTNVKFGDVQGTKNTALYLA